MQQRFLLQIVLLAQHVSGTTMPIIRSSRVLYGGCCLWYFVLWFSSCWSGVELRVMCPVCRMLQHPANRTHKICNKNLCCIYLAFYFHILTTMHSQNNIKFNRSCYGRLSAILTDTLLGIPQSLQKNAGIIPRTEHDPLLPNPYQSSDLLIFGATQVQSELLKRM